MKKTAVLIIILVSALTLFAQQDKNEFYQNRINHFQSMRGTGISLVVVGVVANVIGIPLYIKGLSSDFEGDEDAALGYLGGAVLMVVGEVSIAGGVTLWAFGDSRVRKYKRLLQKSDKGLSLGLSQKGLTLQMRF